MNEWLSVSHPASGGTTVTVSLVDGHLAVKWVVRCFGNIAEGVKEGRKHAQQAMKELREAAEVATL